MTIFFTSVLESILNSALFHDKYINAIRSRLSGKVLHINFDESEWLKNGSDGNELNKPETQVKCIRVDKDNKHNGFIKKISQQSEPAIGVKRGLLNFSFSLLFTKDHIDVFTDCADSADCTITTHLDTLLSLMIDRKKLPLFIREGQLMVEGDIQIIQQWMTLLDLVEWDIAEWLSPYCGDLTAETFKQLLYKGHTCTMSHLKRKTGYLAEAITEEWKLIPPSLAVKSFKEEVCAISLEVDALSARISRMEKNQ